MGMGTTTDRPVRAVGVVRNGSADRLVPWQELARLGLQPRPLGEGGAAVRGVADTDLALLLVPVAEPAGDAILIAGLRAATDAPLLGIAAERDRHRIAELLEEGLDDVLVVPTPPHEFRQRVEALLRRAEARRAPESAQADVASFDSLHVDYGAREVHLNGALVDLTKIEFDILAVLSRAPRVVISRRQLVEAVWDGAWYGDDHMIDVHIGNLRRKLGESGRDQGYIKTVRAVGYKFDSRHTGQDQPEQLALLAATVPDSARASAPATPATPATVAPTGAAALHGTTPASAATGPHLLAPAPDDDWAREAAEEGAVEVFFDEQTRLIAVSGGSSELLGWRLADLIGLPFAPVRLAAGAPSLDEAREALNGMLTRFFEEWRARVPAVRRDGSPAALLVHSRAVYDEHGQFRWVQSILREAEVDPAAPYLGRGAATVDLSSGSSQATPGRVLHSA